MSCLQVLDFMHDDDDDILEMGPPPPSNANVLRDEVHMTPALRGGKGVGQILAKGREVA